MAAAKKPPLAEVIVGMGKPKAASEPDADDSYSAAVDELADILGVSDVEAFRSAFEAAVMSCK